MARREQHTNRSETTGTDPATVIFPDESDEKNTLVYGPALSGKDRIGMEAVAGALTGPEIPIIVTTSDTATQCRERLEPLLPAGASADETLLIDANEATQSKGVTDGWTVSVGSPADLTGIGIALSKGFDRLDEIGYDGRYILVDTLTTLLLYTDFDRVFRFVDDLNRRATESDRTIVSLLDNDAIDEERLMKLVQLFDRAIQVQVKDGTTTFRRRGEREADWHDYEPKETGRER